MKKINLKDIHIGSIIEDVIREKEIEIERICKFFKVDEKTVIQMYNQKSLESDLILKWSKLAEYDFFRPFVSHLMLFHSITQTKSNKETKEKHSIQFRKNIYTNEIKEYILELVNTKQKTISEVMQVYGIPKTTLYKWLNKQNFQDSSE